jgi:hypothetical protein
MGEGNILGRKINQTTNIFIVLSDIYRRRPPAEEKKKKKETPFSDGVVIYSYREQAIEYEMRGKHSIPKITPRLTALVLRCGLC